MSLLIFLNFPNLLQSYICPISAKDLNHSRKDLPLLNITSQLMKVQPKQLKIAGKTIIPLRLFINERGFAKMEIALCQGKHTYDKRQALRAADDKREMQRALKR